MDASAAAAAAAAAEVGEMEEEVEVEDEQAGSPQRGSKKAVHPNSKENLGPKPCPSRKPDGSLCGQPLYPSKKMCSACGAKRPKAQAGKVSKRQKLEEVLAANPFYTGTGEAPPHMTKKVRHNYEKAADDVMCSSQMLNLVQNLRCGVLLVLTGPVGDGDIDAAEMYGRKAASGAYAGCALPNNESRRMLALARGTGPFADALDPGNDSNSLMSSLLLRCFQIGSSAIKGGGASSAGQAETASAAASSVPVTAQGTEASAAAAADRGQGAGPSAPAPAAAAAANGGHTGGASGPAAANGGQAGRALAPAAAANGGHTGGASGPAAAAAANGGQAGGASAPAAAAAAANGGQAGGASAPAAAAAANGGQAGGASAPAAAANGGHTGGASGPAAAAAAANGGQAGGTSTPAAAAAANGGHTGGASGPAAAANGGQAGGASAPAAATAAAGGPFVEEAVPPAAAAAVDSSTTGSRRRGFGSRGGRLGRPPGKGRGARRMSTTGVGPDFLAGVQYGAAVHGGAGNPMFSVLQQGSGFLQPGGAFLGTGVQHVPMAPHHMHAFGPASAPQGAGAGLAGAAMGSAADTAAAAAVAAAAAASAAWLGMGPGAAPRSAAVDDTAAAAAAAAAAATGGGTGQPGTEQTAQAAALAQTRVAFTAQGYQVWGSPIDPPLLSLAPVQGAAQQVQQAQLQLQQRLLGADAMLLVSKGDPAVFEVVAPVFDPTTGGVSSFTFSCEFTM